jgi:hypothetical protein
MSACRASASRSPARKTAIERRRWRGPWRLIFEAKAPRSPLAALRDAATLAPPQALFEHRAMLYTKDNPPFSKVDEFTQRDVLAFPPDSAN